ncbi:MAG TPA: zf-HC2 domain-containing protein [Vicinamibacterales bacterium]|nr:zf-HC2 domain-containing protein [Vicinamibacterales bacterium]
MCEEKELLVSYLYDDLADGRRAAFESHLRGCAACRAELHGLRDVRADLAAWAPPEPDFGFRVVRGGRDAAERDAVRTPPARSESWRAWWTPAAGFAAAAVLVLAAASAIARVEVRSGPDGLTVRTGWSSAVAPSEAAGRFGETSASRPAARDVRLSTAEPVDAAFIAGLERRLAALEAATSHDSGARNASTLSARAADAEIIRRVRELVAKSESRQQGELALRISQVMRDVDAQRVADLAEVRKGLVNITATVRDESAYRRDLTNYILSASTKQK